MPTKKILKTQRLNEFQHDGLTFDVIDSGPLDGQPMLLLHGFPETANSWRYSTEIFNQKGFRTFALNQRGYSLRAQPRGRAAYASHHLVEDVNALLNLIEQPVFLIGHDWGALVAWETAIKYPEKIKHLTAISVPHKAAFVRSFYSSKQLLKSYYIGLFQLPIIPEFLFNNMPQIGEHLLKNSGMTDQQLADFRQEMLFEKRLTPSLNWYRGIPFSSSKSLFSKIKVPTLFIWGKLDSAIDAKSVMLNHQYVDAPYKEIHMDATHWIPVQNAKQLAQHILQEILPDDVE